VKGHPQGAAGWRPVPAYWGTSAFPANRLLRLLAWETEARIVEFEKFTQSVFPSRSFASDGAVIRCRVTPSRPSRIGKSGRYEDFVGDTVGHRTYLQVDVQAFCLFLVFAPLFHSHCDELCWLDGYRVYVARLFTQWELRQVRLPDHGAFGILRAHMPWCRRVEPSPGVRGQSVGQPCCLASGGSWFTIRRWPPKLKATWTGRR
jgi:hypothetical protein